MLSFRCFQVQNIHTRTHTHTGSHISHLDAGRLPSHLHGYFGKFIAPIVVETRADFVLNHMANIYRKNLKLILGF